MPAVKGVGEPCAGEPHARFDGRELETEQAMAADQGSPRETEGPEPGPTYSPSPRQLPTRPSSRGATLVANAGLLLVATLAARLGIDQLVNERVRLRGRVGGALPGPRVLTLVHAICAGASHIDHANVLRAGATGSVPGHRVMAPSTLGTFLRSSTFGHVRQLEAVIVEVLRRAWAMGAGPESRRLVVDVDSTICEVAGSKNQGASFGCTKVRG